MPDTLNTTDFTWLGPRYEGKVRDVYDTQNGLVMISTDRQSAFDISWGSIPYKGQVLTELSTWWFHQVEGEVSHHVIATPDPNVIIAKKLEMLPVEIVVRAYLTGSTQTSIWVNYENGKRSFGGIELPDGMVKNQPLPQILVTPTTKGKKDLPITPDEIVSQKLMSAELWEKVSSTAISLFRKGQEIALGNNLILVDTKYEFGLDSEGELVVGDEVHTPDSSRFWVADTYEKLFEHGEHPQNLDKEFFREWLISQGFDPAESESSTRPVITEEVQEMLSNKYVSLYERVTQQKFIPASERGQGVAERIENRLKAYFST